MRGRRFLHGLLRSILGVRTYEIIDLAIVKMAADHDRNLKMFCSNNGADPLSSQYTSSSAELCAPTEETSEFGRSHPYAKPYVVAASEAQIWSAVDMLKDLEVKLRPVYDGLKNRKLIQDERESLEQQNKILQACEAILETVKNIEKKIPDQPTTEDMEHPNLDQPACEVGSMSPHACSCSTVA